MIKPRMVRILLALAQADQPLRTRALAAATGTSQAHTHACLRRLISLQLAELTPAGYRFAHGAAVSERGVMGLYVPVNELGRAANGAPQGSSDRRVPPR